MVRLSIRQTEGNASAAIRKTGLIGSVGILAVMVLGVPLSYAVVGQAERYDIYREEELREFHDQLVAQERKRAEMDLAVKQLRDLKAEEEGESREAALGEVAPEDREQLERELLGIVERDRFRMGLEGRYLYDTNISRKPPRQEKGDSVLDVTGFTEFDLSGKKTDLRFEIRGAKEWNIHFPTSDFWMLEERLRYRRKYFRKLLHSVQSRLVRINEKTIEIDTKKIRYDSFQNMNFHTTLFRKLEANVEVNWIKRVFTTEPYDQDSTWEWTLVPSAVWAFTPKSRIFLGYRFGANRIRTKVGDSNSHEVATRYFGKITRKTSASIDLAFSHQTKRSAETPKVNTVTVGTGLIYQWTPKTQVTLQFIRSLQNSTSNRVSGTEDETTKEDVHFINDSLSLSMNSRLMRKLTAVITLNTSHVRTKVERGGNKDAETRQFTFPVSVILDYMIKRWLRWQLSYTFAFRTGDEKSDTYRTHQWLTSVSMTF